MPITAVIKRIGCGRFSWLLFIESNRPFSTIINKQMVMRALLLAALLLVSVAASSPVLNNRYNQGVHETTNKNGNSFRVEMDSGAENRGGNGDDSDSYEDESDVTNKNYFAKKQLDHELNPSKRNGSLSFGIGQIIVDKVCNVADNLKWSKLFRKKEYKFIDVDDWFPDESGLHNSSLVDSSSCDEADEEDSPKKNDNGGDYGCDEVLRAQFPHLFQDPHFYNG